MSTTTRRPTSAAKQAHAPAGRVAWRLATYQRARFIRGVLAWSTFWITPAILGLGLQAIFDRISGEAQAGLTVPSLLVLLLVVEGARLAVFYTSILMWTRWWVHSETLLRTNMLRAQLASGGREAGAPVRHSGSAVAVFRNDVEDLILYLDTWVDIVGTVVFGIIALAIMVRVDATVTLVVVVPLLLAFFVTRVLTERLRAFRRADREATAHVTGFLGNLFSAVLAVKVAGAERSAIGRLRRLNATRRRTVLRDRLLYETLEAFNGSTVEISIGLVLLLVAPAMRSGDFTVGDLALFATYVTWLAALPRWTGRLLSRHRHAQVAVGRMSALVAGSEPDAVVAHRPLQLDSPAPLPVRPRPPAPPAAHVTARGLAYAFEDGSGIEAIDLDLAPGTFTVVCGPVGSGKTTLLRALLGLVDGAEGAIDWDGETVTEPAAFMVPPHTGYLPQVPRLFSASLRENLTLGVQTDDDALSDAIRRAALDRDLDGMDDGLDTLVGPRGVRLSGGQVQRAATARALTANPALLVLDDLSSALDADTERRLWARLLDGEGGAALSRRPTCLVVSHRAAALERADQILVLERGRVRASGTLDELRARGLDPLALHA